MKDHDKDEIEPLAAYVNKDVRIQTNNGDIDLDHYELWAFKKGRKFNFRVRQLSELLRQSINNSDLGKALDIDEDLAIEFKRLLGSVCYLFNSTSFREGRYMKFDKDEVDRKLGRKI